MKEFKIFVENRPGELARVTDALAERAVNIKAIASESGSTRPYLRVVTNDVMTTEKALSLAGLPFEVNEILDISLPDKPGELAKVARRLARAGVNVESIYILRTHNGMTDLALVVSDLKKASVALK